MTIHSSTFRIISLLPSATEILFAIGAGSQVVGVTHECDFPPEAQALEHCTGNLLPPNLSAKEIDVAVSAALISDEHSIYSLDTEKVKNLKPDVIVTQSLCAVCAVPERSVKELSCTMPQNCHVVSSDPKNLAQLFDSILYIGKSVGHEEGSAKLVANLKQRLCNVRNGLPMSKPRVAVIEWPDPPYAPGHWVPDMIEYAGGTCILGKTGDRSVRVTWDSLSRLKPDVVICAFCGYKLKENESECDEVRDGNEWKTFVGEGSVYATNASAYFSRPGNRLVDGTELLAYIIHRVQRFKPERNRASVLKSGEWIDLAEE